MLVIRTVGLLCKGLPAVQLELAPRFPRRRFHRGWKHDRAYDSHTGCTDLRCDRGKISVVLKLCAFYHRVPVDGSGSFRNPRVAAPLERLRLWRAPHLPWIPRPCASRSWYSHGATSAWALSAEVSLCSADPPIEISVHGNMLEGEVQREEPTKKYLLRISVATPCSLCESEAALRPC